MSTTTPNRDARVLPATVFILTQLLILGAAVAAVGYRWTRPADAFALPELRETPLEIRPVYDSPVVVTDEQLTRVLTRLRPKWDGAQTKINSIDHALRFWGVEANFGDRKHPSGEEMRQLLLNQTRFQQLYGKAGEALPLLMPTPPGVRVRVNEGEMSSSHVDHTAASLAEVGTPLSFPIETVAGPGTYRQVVEQVFRDFSLNQVEYEWSTMVFALFAPSPDAWRTKEGQTMTFDRLAERLMRQEQPQGVCFGNHRLYSLVILLRVHDQSPILSANMHAKVVAYLQEITKQLVATQHPDGCWNMKWPTEAPASSTPSEVEGDRLSDRIIATGHALEWWAMVPEHLAPQLHPERDVLVKAGQWIVRTVDSLEDREIPTHFTFLSHAGRSLALWRGKFAYEVPLRESAPQQP